MSFDIKPTRNVVDTNAEVIALIEANTPTPSVATPVAFGTLKGVTNDANVALGPNALERSYNDPSGGNTVVGSVSMYDNITGGGNAAFGGASLRFNVSGYYNAAFGYGALISNTTGHSNVSVGYTSLDSITSGTYNTGVGRDSLTSTSTGSYNTAVGYLSGYGFTDGVGNFSANGSNNTYIGYDSRPSSSSASNQITLGNSSITTLRAQVTSITSLSDARDKKNIESLPTGLDFVNLLNPVKFDWNMRDGGKVDVPDTGFIAQDLVEVEDKTGIADYLKLTFRDNPDKLEASYGRLVPILVKAIQDLSAKVTELEEKLNG